MTFENSSIGPTAPRKIQDLIWTCICIQRPYKHPNIDFQLNTIEVKQMPKRALLVPKKCHLKMFCNGPADIR